MQVDITGSLYYPDDVSHEEFVQLLMRGFRSVDIKFTGETRIVDHVKIYEKTNTNNSVEA